MTTNTIEPQKKSNGKTWVVGGVSLFIAAVGFVWNAAGTVNELKQRLSVIESTSITNTAKLITIESLLRSALDNQKKP